MRFVACHGLCGWQGFRKSKDVWWMLPYHCYLSQSLCSSTPVSASVAYMYTVYIFGFFLSRCQFPKMWISVILLSPIDFPIPLLCTKYVHCGQNFLIKWDIFTYWYMYHHLFQGDFNLIFLNMCMVWKSFTPSVTNECKALNEFDALM